MTHWFYRMVPDLGQTSSSSGIHGFETGWLRTWTQSKSVQNTPQKEDGLCVHCIHVHTCTRKSDIRKMNCVQCSFCFYVIGLVFLDFGSRHKDQPLISCSWQLRLCLLFIGQHRMDHVTRHICTLCLGMWQDTQVGTDWWRKMSPEASVDPSSSSPYCPYSLILCMTTKAFLFVSRKVIIYRERVNLRRIVMVMYCVCAEQHLDSPSLLPLPSWETAFPWGSHLVILMTFSAAFVRYHHFILFQLLPLSEEVSVIGPVL